MKILIAMHYMELGGAEAALLGLLQSVDPKRADVDVFIYAHRGELMPYVKGEGRDCELSELSELSAKLTELNGESRKKWNLLPEVAEYTMLERPISELVKKGYWRLALARLWGRWEDMRYKKYNVKGLESNAHVTFQQHRTVKCLPMINPDVEYDLAISFLTPHYIVLDKVRAKKKLGWIHTDYTNVFINREMEQKMWERLDVISSISSDVTEKFCEVFPSLKDRIIDIENILSPGFIRKRSQESCPIFEQDSALKLLTIGRYSKAKKMEDIPYLCRRLVDALLVEGKLNGVEGELNGVEMELRGVEGELREVERGVRDIKWYIIGYGSAEIEQQVRDEIRKEGMEEHVILLGKQANPYPYIRCCDVYVQPSRYEGKSITVREAQILCKPVIVTHYPTAPSQVNGKDGVIVPLEREACADEMIKVLKDKELLAQLEEYLKCHDYGNENEIERIYRIAQS